MVIPDPLATGLAWFLVWLFGQAAWHKFGAPDFYAQLVRGYLGALWPGRMAVWLVAALEAAIALSLLLPATRAYALVAAAILLLGYAGLMAMQLRRGAADMQCGCAGPDSQLGISWALVLRNGVCAGLALLALTAAGGGLPGWTGLALAVFVALFAVLVYQTCEQIISNAQWMAGEA